MLSLKNKTDRQLNGFDTFIKITSVMMYILFFICCFFMYKYLKMNVFIVITVIGFIICSLSVIALYELLAKIKEEKINRKISKYLKANRYDDKVISEFKYFINEVLDTDSVHLLYYEIEKENIAGNIMDTMVNIMIRYNYHSSYTKDVMIFRINKLMNSLSFTQKEIEERQVYLRKQHVKKLREIHRKLRDLKSERTKYNGITEKDFYSPLDEKSNNLI